MSARVKHAPGARFGSLVIVERLGVRRGSQRVLARCDCGTVREYNLPNLASGATVQCSDRTAHPDRRWKGQHVTYGGAHNRVKRTRGSASGYACVSCGQPAEHWAYSHGDPDERADASGKEKGRPYSARPEHYAPRCRACHAKWDAAERRHTERHAPGSLSLVHHALWLAYNGTEAAC